MRSPFEATPEIVPKLVQKTEIVPGLVQEEVEPEIILEEELEEPQEEVEVEEEEVEEIIEEKKPEEEEPEEIEGEVVESDLKLEFDPVLKDQTFAGDTFVAPVPLLHLEYNFQMGDVFKVISKNPTNHEIIFRGDKTSFSLFDPSNFNVINIGDIYKVVSRNSDLSTDRPYDYNITFERTKKGEYNVW